jgi:hypothetical protein
LQAAPFTFKAWRKYSGWFSDERCDFASQHRPREVMLDQMADEFAGQCGDQRVITGPDLDIVLVT